MTKVDLFSLVQNNYTRIVSIGVATLTGTIIGSLNYILLGLPFIMTILSGLTLGLVVGFICCKNINKDASVLVSSNSQARPKVFSAFTALD